MDKIRSSVFTMFALTIIQIKKFALSLNSYIYDTLISKLLTNYSYERLATLLNAYKKNHKDTLRILDIGVGTAVPLYHIWNRLPMSLEIIGVDIDHSYILKA